MQNIDGNMHPLWQSLSDRNQVSRYKLQMPKEQNAPQTLSKVRGPGAFISNVMNM